MAFFIILFLTGFVILLMGWLNRKYPPDYLNQYYGYRTGSASKSPETWELAQKLSSRYFMASGAVLIGLSFTGIVFAINNVIGTILAMALISIGIIIPVFLTEKSLKP